MHLSAKFGLQTESLKGQPLLARPLPLLSLFSRPRPRPRPLPQPPPTYLYSTLPHGTATLPASPEAPSFSIQISHLGCPTLLKLPPWVPTWVFSPVGMVLVCSDGVTFGDFWGVFLASRNPVVDLICVAWRSLKESSQGEEEGRHQLTKITGGDVRRDSVDQLKTTISCRDYSWVMARLVDSQLWTLKQTSLDVGVDIIVEAQLGSIARRTRRGALVL